MKLSINMAAVTALLAAASVTATYCVAEGSSDPEGLTRSICRELNDSETFSCWIGFWRYSYCCDTGDRETQFRNICSRWGRNASCG